MINLIGAFVWVVKGCCWSIRYLIANLRITSKIEKDNSHEVRGNGGIRL